MATITLIAAFIAGIASFLSPCVLPILPGFLAYLSGTTSKDAAPSRLKLFMSSLLFVIGFSTVFALFGVLLNSTLQNISYGLQIWLSRIGGLVIILFGLFLLGLLNISFLQQDHKIELKRKFKNNYIGSFIFGAAFAVGWSPCVGAILGSIFTLAITEPQTSFLLLLIYALGLGLPFLIAGLFASQTIVFISKFKTFFKYFNIVIGIFLIILGILVFTQTLSTIANFSFLNKVVLS